MCDTVLSWALFAVLVLQVNIGRVDVLEVSGSSITVASRKDLQLERYIAAAAAAGTDGTSGSNGGSSGSSVLWRLDQDEAASIGMHQRAAVLRLAADNTCTHVQRLRELIVDLAAPRLMDALQHSQQQQQQDKPVRARSSSPQPVVWSLGQQQVRTGDRPADRAGSAPPAVTAATAAAPAAAVPAGGGAPVAASPAAPAPFGAAARLAAASGESYLANHGAHLNSNQVAVLRRVMAMQDYCLVLGMPGELAGTG